MVNPKNSQDEDTRHEGEQEEADKLSKERDRKTKDISSY